MLATRKEHGKTSAKRKERTRKKRTATAEDAAEGDAEAPSSRSSEEVETNAIETTKPSSSGDVALPAKTSKKKKRKAQREKDEKGELERPVNHPNVGGTHERGTATRGSEPIDKIQITTKDVVTESAIEVAAQDNSTKKRRKRKKPEPVKSEAANVQEKVDSPGVEERHSGYQEQVVGGADAEPKLRKKRRTSREKPDAEREHPSTLPDEGLDAHVSKGEGEAVSSEEKGSASIVVSAKEERGAVAVDERSDPRLFRTLFVGNVSQKATSKDIKKVFKPFGRIESVRIRGVVPVNPKIPKRTALLTNRLAEFSDSFQAYVVFEDTKEVGRIMEEACQKVNMTVFMERHIRVMPAGHQRHGPRTLSLFLGNLPFDCSEEELITTFKELTESIGVEVVNARVNRDKDTGVGRGIGFVTFSDSLGVQGCMNAMGDVKIRGRVVRMEPASKMKKKNTKTHRRGKANEKMKNTQLQWKGAGRKYLSGKGGRKAPGSKRR